jgi:5,10-methylenetetrahydromethanopterin reductase
MSNSRKCAALPRIGVRIPACAPIDQVADLIMHAERLGFDSAWLPDSQLIWRDTWMALALAATRTSTITLGTAVTNVVTRHPSVVASATRTLLELAPGRFVLGLGVGWSSAGMVGLPTTKHREFSQAVSDIRALLRGGTVQFNDVDAELTDCAGECPIYLGSQGPRNLHMAGELGDGVILTMTLPPALLEARLAHVQAGIDAAKRRREDVEIVVWAPILVTTDLNADLKRLKPMILVSLRNQPKDELAAAGIFERYEGPVPPGIEPDGTHIADLDIAVESCNALVSDELARRWIEAFALSGTSDELKAKCSALRERGVGTVVLTPLGEDNSQQLPTRMIEDVAKALLLN